MTALNAAATTVCWAALPIAILAAARAAGRALSRRADRRWENRQQAAARQRDPDRAAWDDIVTRLTREERKP